MHRIGHGYDTHSFELDRPLVLGGVVIPYEKGLKAHSDGDVIIHALCDALLGAAALGDIGQHFPDTDAQYRNCDSRFFLKEVLNKITAKEFQINNIDITVLAQAPKLLPFIPLMKDNLATDLAIAVDQINIKATTTEKMGFVGRQEGIACYATALLNQG
jgi:2-C-methyl-D-erythritol 2,4-cyclodiphosphate synthase